ERQGQLLVVGAPLVGRREPRVLLAREVVDDVQRLVDQVRVDGGRRERVVVAGPQRAGGVDDGQRRALLTAATAAATLATAGSEGEGRDREAGGEPGES